MLPILISVAVIGSLALAVALFFQKGREGIDLAPRSLLRVYLYIASFAGVIVLSTGIAALLTIGLASAVGRDSIYGGTSSPQPAIECITGEKCPQVPSAGEQRRQRTLDQDRRFGEDLIGGLTSAILGAIFFGAHWVARRTMAMDEAGSALRRMYFMLGTVAFGLATIALLPSGITNALSNALLTADPNRYREPATDLGSGIVSLFIWLLYLRLVVRDFRRGA